MTNPQPLAPDDFSGIWSATPTPLDDQYFVDEEAVSRLVEHHCRLPVKGLFVAGTCGEGPWLRDACRWRLLRRTVAASAGRLKIAMQVSDNSVPRILENIEHAREAGADLVVIAEPFFLMNATPANLIALYEKAVAGSSLPVCVYLRGRHANVKLTAEVLEVIYRLPGVVAIKDSSSDPASRDIALQVREENPALRLLNGDEFLVSDYFAAGYDGALVGGAVFNAAYAEKVRQEVAAGRLEEARQWDDALRELNWKVYGGRDNGCWLAGLKRLLKGLGVFGSERHFLNFPLSAECAQAVDALVAQPDFWRPEAARVSR